MSEQNEKHPAYRGELLWTVGTVVIPLGWPDLAPALNVSATVYACIGWILWAIPYLMAVQMLWQYLRQRHLRLLLRILVVIVILGPFCYAAALCLSPRGDSCG